MAEERPQSLGALIESLREFVRERDWEQFHNPKNLAMALASEAGELVAELRWLTPDECDALQHDPVARHRVAEELGDVILVALLLSMRLGIDPLVAGFEKLAINRERYPIDEAYGRSERPPSIRED